MTALTERMPHVAAFPRALGTGIIVRSAAQLSHDDHATITSFIDTYESVLSRFRTDSLVTAIGDATHGGTFDFPDWSTPLFDLYDTLCAATDGAIDPCVGEDLMRLGYGADYTFTVAPDADGRLGAVHGRPTWRGDVERYGSTLVTRRAVHLDFGACGKGYLVDLLSAMMPHDELLIDAGGDLFVRSSQPVVVALEDPDDVSRAVGIAEISAGACCASAPSRRHWRAAGQLALHHLLNAIDGRPVRDVAATWTVVRTDDRQTALSTANYPTAVADGLATALFVADPNLLAARVPDHFECAVLRADRTAAISHHFPGHLFVQ